MHLTPREKQVAQRLLKAEKRSAIAQELEISVWTVDFHIINIKRKMRESGLQSASLLDVVIFFFPESCGSS